MPYQNIPDDDEDQEQANADTIADHIQAEIRKQQEKEKATRRVDYANFRDESKDCWEDLVDDEDFPLQLETLFKKAILLPRAAFQTPIILSYLMLPSAICTRVPIGFSNGGSGCGKSALGYLACKVHNSSPISAGSTFASIRNTVASMRRWDDEADLEEPGNERNAALVWEDISPQHLVGENNHVFALLKNGVERSGTITIAKKEGGNETFKIFSPKYISSIHPIYSMFEFRELVRRMIVFQHKPRMVWVSEDFDHMNEDVDPDNLIDLQDISFDYFANAFRDFWENPNNLQEWVSVHRSLKAVRNHGMSGNDFKMSKDIIASGVVCRYFSTVREGVDHMARYWEWHRDNVESQSSATTKALARFVESKTRENIERNEQFISQGMKQFCQPIEVSAKELRMHVLYLKEQGELDTNSNVSDINAAMGQLGWSLRSNDKGQNSWQPLNS